VAREFAVRLLTNGTWITVENADRVAALGLTCIDVSVLGDEAAHERITAVPGSYARARDAVALLRERGQQVNIKFPVMKANIDDYEHVRALADQYGTGLVVDVTLACRNDGDTAPLDLMCSGSELTAFLARIGRNDAMQPVSNLSADGPSCNAGISLARISHKGGVHSCVASPQQIGSLRERSFADIWNDAGFDAWRRQRLGDLPICRTCAARHACIRCPGMAQAEGDVHGPSLSACRMAKVRLDMMARQAGHAESDIVPAGLRGRDGAAPAGGCGCEMGMSV
jgi:radical SAM protein with 4Fe4S-binding SPASM domain